LRDPAVVERAEQTNVLHLGHLAGVDTGSEAHRRLWAWRCGAGGDQDARRCSRSWMPQLEVRVEHRHPSGDRLADVNEGVADDLPDTVEVELGGEDPSAVASEPFEMPGEPSDLEVVDQHRGEVPIVREGQCPQLVDVGRLAVELRHEPSVTATGVGHPAPERRQRRRFGRGSAAVRRCVGTGAVPGYPGR
jgi:hypothetical protein